jgi:hypothetical protein
VTIDGVLLKDGTSSAAEPVALAPADAPITATVGAVFVTKATAAALTLAAPANPADDGKILRVIAATAAAHTVTQATPGFNNAGAAADVATFGGAIGDNLEIIARAGIWYVLSTRNVTLA